MNLKVTLFPNDKKGVEKRPDLRNGKFEVPGTELVHQIAAWIREPHDGNKPYLYLNMGINYKEERKGKSYDMVFQLDKVTNAKSDKAPIYRGEIKIDNEVHEAAVFQNNEGRMGLVIKPKEAYKKEATKAAPKEKAPTYDEPSGDSFMDVEDDLPF